MGIEQFAEAVKEELQRTRPEYEYSINKIEKIQTETYLGLVVKKSSSNAGITINMDKLVKEEGTDLEEAVQIIGEIIESQKDQWRQIDEMQRDILDYESMKNTLMLQIVSTEKNKNILKDVPHKELEDMSVVCRFCLAEKGDDVTTVMINNAMVDEMGITAEQLFEDAERIAPQVNNPVVLNISQVLNQMSGQNVFEDVPLWVASTKRSIDGAAVLAYPGFLEMMADTFEKSFYIIPSSIHEVLLLPDDGYAKADELVQMVKSTNKALVQYEDVLTDSAYRYDAEKHLFETVQKYEERVKAQE